MCGSARSGWRPGSVIWRIVTSTADTIAVVVERDGGTKTFMVSPQKDVEHEHHWWQRKTETTCTSCSVGCTIKLGTTRNQDAWYEAFGVTPDQKYYLAPDQRVHLW